MISQKQVRLRDSLKQTNGDVSGKNKELYTLLGRFAYSDSDLELIENQINIREGGKQ